MDDRATKLALARKKLKDHQEKKTFNLKEDRPNDVNDIENSLSGNVDNGQVPQNDSKMLCYDSGNIDLISSPNSKVDLLRNEVLISRERELELQINDLQAKLSMHENNYDIQKKHNSDLQQQLHNLKNDVELINNKYLNVVDDIAVKSKSLIELNSAWTILSNNNNSLQEQLELTKAMLTSKENELSSVSTLLADTLKQLEVTQLQLQQMTNNTATHEPQDDSKEIIEQNESLHLKVNLLEQQLKTTSKEKDQLNSYYELHVSELNEHLKLLVGKNEDYIKQIDHLSHREQELVDQIGEMEIRLQRILGEVNQPSTVDSQDLQHKYNDAMKKVEEVTDEVECLKKKLFESENKIEELSFQKEKDLNTSNISFSKLSADIMSDKVAAQRATEQNAKLKQDLKELEEAFVKMSKDKLELTEKIAAEKFLNRELTIKLAEIEEKATDMHIKLMAKDGEMIRLQSSFRNLTSQVSVMDKNHEHLDNNLAEKPVEENLTVGEDVHESQADMHKCHSLVSCDENLSPVKKEEAMLKLEERFLKIMDQVANLSDEKHRLEHIVLQLQNETDTICEYVALYQQQRIMLKSRDEERTAQLKIFQSECDQLKRHLEELTDILVRFAEDADLVIYFQNNAKKNDLEKVMKLLSNLKHNIIIDPVKKNLQLNNFYPCSCCSGKLIEI